MTQHARTTRHQRKWWPSRFRAVLLALVLATAVCPVAEAAPEDRPSRDEGYRIPSNGRADGGWIGGYRVDGTTMFLTTPTKRPNRRGFGPERLVEDVKGSRGPSQRDTVRAAWVLSKYGGYRDATQAAAVDAVVYHLLAGKRWRITHGRGGRRIRASRDPASVRRFARIMLRESRRDAGPYSASVTTAGADVGGTVATSVTVASHRGRPAAGLPVTFAFPGAEPVAAVTGDDGRAVARFPAARGGWQHVTATVEQVPEHRLHLHPPVRAAQASAAEGGVRRTLVVAAPAAVRGPQSLSVAGSPQTLVTGTDATATVTVTGDGLARTATATLHGPFGSAAAAQCTGDPVGSVSATVAADGAYALPPLRPTTGGYYAWRAAVDATATSLPGSACSTPIKVRSTTATGVTADAALAQSGEVGASAAVSGLPLAARVTMTGTLFGPYGSEALRSSDRCGTSHAAVSRTRTGNGNVHFTIEALEPGFYAWQAETPAGDLWLGSRSPCLATGTLMRVQ